MKVFWRSKRAITRLETILVIVIIAIAALAGYLGYLVLTPPAPPTPGEFELSNLSISSALVTEGESVTVSVNVTNTGESAVTGPITLSLNGRVQETKSITLEAGEEKTVTFTVATSTGWAGDYTVLIGALTGTFRVRMAIKNPGTIIVATIGEPETVDPAWAYDTASAELVFNVYDTLIFFDGEATDKFVPQIATEWVEAGPPHPQAPAGTNNTYYFKIRSGVKFHNGATLTTEDVEYSFERALVQDRSGGPVWMFYEPLLNRFHSRNATGDIVVNPTQLDQAVESNSTHVWFNLVIPYPPFLQILSQSWASIVNKAWCIQQGDWPGTWGNWTLYNDPEVSPLDSPSPVMMGTGPFKFEAWEKGTQWSIVRFDDYWQGPAKIQRAVVQKISEWATRKLKFQGGDADIVDVPRENIKEIENVTGIRGVKDLPQLAMTAAFFNFNISTTSAYVPKVGGVDKPNLFADKNMRLAFAHAFDWETFIEDVWLGEASQPASPIIDGLPFHNPNAAKYTFNLTKAEEYFKQAWNGDVWANGFELTILFNIGNVARQTAAEMFRDNVEGISDKFDIRIVGVEWPVYLGQLVDHELTLFIIGWLADYPDPHNFAMPFMHTEGDFSFFQSYSNSTVDALVEEGIRTTNATRRQEIYYELQLLYYQDVPSLPLYQPLGRHWERDWIKGWYYNPIYPGQYFYALSKEY